MTCMKEILTYIALSSLLCELVFLIPFLTVLTQIQLKNVHCLQTYGVCREKC
jgi:hypothetical protein